MKVHAVVKEAREVQFLVETIFSMNSRFTLGRVAALKAGRYPRRSPSTRTGSTGHGVARTG